MKKSAVTQELVNVFPSWTRVRTDDQSVGYQYLNAAGLSLEKAEKELIRSRSNQYLSTFNLDEIDLTYKVDLPRDFEFEIDLSDPTEPSPLAPTVSGLIDDTYYEVIPSLKNDIESFWYTKVPDRVSLGDVVSGVDYELLSFLTEESPVSGIFRHHLGGGDLWIETAGGIQYITFQDNEVLRGQVIIEGTTRKGTKEKETIIFPWDMKQKTQKEWKKITNISTYNIESGVNVSLRSADFGSDHYLSPWNLRYSENRNKIDEFWALGIDEGIPTLDRVEYITDEWQQLVLGFSDRAPVESWELLDYTSEVLSGVNVTVSGIDLALQPFTDRAWVVADGNLVYVYDTREDIVSGVDLLRDSTPGADVAIEVDTPSVVFGQDILFTPWHIRPLKQIIDYSVWYETPSGQRYGLLDGVQVSYTSEFNVKIPEGDDLTRSIGNLITIPATERGEYLLVLEVTYVDGTEQEYRRIVPVNYKTPLAKYDLSSLVPDPITGIDFDADQRLWVKTSTDYYQIELHTDIMIIDYQQKIIYFKEDYDEVLIRSNE